MDTGAVMMYPFQATILRQPGTHMAPSEDLVPEMELQLTKRMHDKTTLITGGHCYREMR